MPNEELKSAHEWLKDRRVQNVKGKRLSIYDADGWNYNDKVTLDTPISLDDFNGRFNACTVMIKDV